MKVLWMLLAIAGIGFTVGCDSGPTTTTTPDPTIESAEYEETMQSVPAEPE